MTHNKLASYLPLRVGEAKHYRTGESFGRGLEILDKGGLTIARTLYPEHMHALVFAANNHAALVAALERIISTGERDIARAGEGHCAGLSYAIAQAEAALAPIREDAAYAGLASWATGSGAREDTPDA